MNILAMDTSNKALSVAVTISGEVIAELTTNIKKNHSARLMPAVEHVMQEAKLKPEELDQIAVAKGPGSYTGVRIGLATAKSMAWSLGISVVGVSSLEVIAWQGRLFNGCIVPFFDARRGLVFTGAYQWDNGQMVLTDHEQNILMEDWLDELKQRDSQILFLSPDTTTFHSMIVNKLPEKAVIPEGSFHIPKASHLALIGEKRAADEIHTLTPNYLRMAEAEAKWLAAQKDSVEND